MSKKLYKSRPTCKYLLNIGYQSNLRVVKAIWGRSSTKNKYQFFQKKQTEKNWFNSLDV